MRPGWQTWTIGGVSQWVSLRGPDDGPALLFLHGGPGASEYGARRRWLGALEASWRVVDWEQRGAGRSYRPETVPADLDTLVSDGVAVVERVCAELGVERVTLVGHSFGTVLGVEIARRAPERVAAYVGASQAVNWALQEERSYDWALAQARTSGHARAVAALEGIGRPVEGVYASGVDGVWTQRRWLGQLGGVCVDPSFLTRFVLSALLSRSYPLGAKLRFQRAMRASMENLWPELGRRVDLARDVPVLAVPVWLFSGEQDRITDLDQVRSWAAGLSAPSLHVEVVRGAGHLAPYEAPERFLATMDEVRAAVTAGAARKAG